MFGHAEKIPDDANALAAQVQQGASVEQFYRLRIAMQARREWIDKRIGAIGGTPGFESPERLQALKRGASAVQALDKEIEDLTFERQYLDRLEQLAVQGSNEAEVAAWHKEIPKSVQRMPIEMAAVRKALAALDNALSKLNDSLHLAGKYDTARMPFPVDDATVAELLNLREEIWTVRHVAVLIPPEPSSDSAFKEHLKRFALAYHVKGGSGVELQYELRYGPRFPSAFPLSN